jgi:hypothetical protein
MGRFRSNYTRFGYDVNSFWRQIFGALNDICFGGSDICLLLLKIRSPEQGQNHPSFSHQILIEKNVNKDHIRAFLSFYNFNAFYHRLFGAGFGANRSAAASGYDGGRKDAVRICR